MRLWDVPKALSILVVVGTSYMMACIVHVTCQVHIQIIKLWTWTKSMSPNHGIHAGKLLSTRRTPHPKVLAFPCISTGSVARRKASTSFIFASWLLSLWPLTTKARSAPGSWAHRKLKTKDVGLCWDNTLDKPRIPWGVRAFCPQWPPYDGNGSTLSESDRQAIRAAVLRSLSPFSQSGGIKRETLHKAMKQRCMQRLCMHMQIIGGKLFVVAPHSKKCHSYNEPDSPCNATVRRMTPGLRPELEWDTEFSPTDLEWHFYAGINVSDCSTHVRAGDFNGPYTRLRMIAALRMIEEAAPFVADTEFVWCANECPVNAGSWCLKGKNPIFSSTSNVQDALIVFPHWMPNLRDVDFWTWDAARRSYLSATRDVRGQLPVAVFRGGLYRLNVYTDEWRTRGVARTALTPENRHRLGRTALLSVKQSASDAELVNVNFNSDEYNLWAPALGVGKQELKQLDEPTELPLSQQSQRFRYTINVEGHGGWADRLYRLLLAPQLVLSQDLPFQLWYEAFLQPGKTHLVIDSSLRNLSDAVRWARENSADVDAMIVNAHKAMDMALSVSAIRMYVRELLVHYGALLSSPTTLHPRAVRLACTPTAECRRCETPTDASRTMRVCGAKCTYRVADGRFDTLHAASHAAGFHAKSAERGAER